MRLEVPAGCARRLLAILLLAGLLTASPSTVAGGVPSPQAPPPSGASSDPANNTTVNKTAITSLVVIETNWGSFTLGMWGVGAPITVANFVNLTNSGFYNGIKFHRVIDDFVAQTGDPNTKNSNPYDDGSGGSATTIPLEVDPDLTHIDGAVGMARSSDPNSASSQFYMCDGPQHQLNGNYSVFGVTVNGMEVVRKIAAAPTYGYKRPLLKDHPVDDIVMISVKERPLPPNATGNGDGVVDAYPAGVSIGQQSFLVLGVAVITGVVVLFVIRRIVRRIRNWNPASRSAPPFR